MNSKNNQNEINIGDDIGRIQLNIYSRPLDIYFTIKHNESVIKRHKDIFINDLLSLRS